jgi:hypothetical protein
MTEYDPASLTHDAEVVSREELEAEPFGNPDGSRADIGDLLREFVDFNDASFGGLATAASDRRARVLVGKTGTGKTVYLRRAHADASKDNSMYTASIQQEVPDTQQIMRLSDLYPNRAFQLETWTSLWTRSILASVVSHVLCEPELRSQVGHQHLEQLETTYGELVGRPRSALAVHVQLGGLLARHSSAKRLDAHLRDTRWAELREIARRALSTLKPICMYIDGLDEHFAVAPMYWVPCQEGLFQAVMRFLRDPDWGNRVHIVVCIRDVVLSSALTGEHAERLRNEPHIRILEWDYRAIQRLLTQKLRHLPDRFWLKEPEGPFGRTLETWLDRSEIHNEVRNVDEPVEDYLFRHTRLIPRDIVQLGNDLARVILRARAAGKTRLGDDAIRQVVARSSAYFGDQQLEVSANHVASDMVPPYAATHQYADFFGAKSPYARTISDTLRKFVRGLSSDRFTWEQLQAAAGAAEEKLEGDTDIGQVMWQNGLLGYDCNQPGADFAHFYSAVEGSFRLPEGKATYVFHPCLVDAVDLAPQGPPVRGYRRPVRGYRR